MPTHATNNVCRSQMFPAMLQYLIPCPRPSLAHNFTMAQQSCTYHGWCVRRAVSQRNCVVQICTSMTCVAGELRCVCRSRTCREIQRRVGTAQQLKKPWVARTSPTSLRRIPLAGALEPHRYRSARRCCTFSQCPCLDPWLLTNCHGRWSYLTVTPTATLTLPGRSTSKANMLQACLRRLLRPAMPEMPATLQSLF